MTLSIITPIYNTPIALLKECLESVKNSDIKYPYEHILINDGSTNPEILNFLNSYQYENTTIIHKENRGVSSARNLGLKQAKGKFILCLDADDILLPQINKAIEFLNQNSDYDVVYCDIEYFGDINKTFVAGNFSKFKQIYISNLMAVSSLFRREITNNALFKENLRYAEDWDFWAVLASKGYNFKYLKKPFFRYRKLINGESFSQKYYSERNSNLEIMRQQFNPYQEITLKNVNEYVLNSFRDNKKYFLKLFFILFTPP